MDLTLERQAPADVGRLHVVFRRENPTTEKRDFELLPLRKNKGRYVGTVIGMRDPTRRQACEGEVKVYMDGDTQFPTICGTGTEDYAGLAWGISQLHFLYHGCTLAQKDFYTFYRWHLPDPYSWRKEARITIQQMTWSPQTRAARGDAQRLELRHVLVRADAERTAAAAARPEGANGRSLERLERR